MSAVVKTSNRKVFALRETKPFANPYLAGTLLGIVLFLAFFLTGNGLGASGGLNRIVVYLQNLVACRSTSTRCPTCSRWPAAAPTRWTTGCLADGRHAARGASSPVAATPGQAGNQQGPAHRQQDALDHGLPGRRVHGIRRAAGARLHLRARRCRAARCCRSAAGPSCSRCSPGRMRWHISCASCGTRTERTIMTPFPLTSG
jgi:hypothetical protein